MSFSPSCCCKLSKSARCNEVSSPLYVFERYHGYLWIRTDITLCGDQVVPLHDDKNRTKLNAKIHRGEPERTKDNNGDVD